VILPTDRLSFTVAGSYTDATAEMATISFPEPAAGLAAGYYDYDFSMVHEYSDLDMQQFSIELDAEYDITPELALGIGGSVTIYEDNDPYLVDDSGELYIGTVSLKYTF
jgi:hypothetical protein